MTKSPDPLAHRKADHPIDPRFLDRWSPRAFSQRTMTRADVEAILEAARWAPSGSNLQPWRFAWALRGEPAFEAMVEAMMPGNREWAPRAAALVTLASRTHGAGPDGDRRPFASHEFDAGAAWMAMALQARADGWAAHAMAGIHPEEAAKSLHLPADHRVHTIIALGQPGDPATLNDRLRPREVPSGRMPLSDIAGHGAFPKA